MKILQIHNFYQFKGGEDGVVESENNLLQKKGINVVKLNAHNDSISNILKARKEFYNNLNQILELNDIDVVHIHNVYQIIGNEIYNILSAKGIPIVQTLHNFRFLCPAGLMLDNKGSICEKCSSGSYYNAFLKKCYQNSYPKSLIMQHIVKKGRVLAQSNVDVFISLNEFYKNKYIEYGFPENKIEVKPNFLASALEIQYSLDESYALIMGRLSPEKGIEVAIEAFKHTDYKLKIAGTGNEEYTKQLKASSANYPNIEWIGFVSGVEKTELIKLSNYLIVPSIWYENFPMTILEAYSFGKPVIASNIGGLPSLVNDGQTGHLFKPNEPWFLLDALHKIYENKNYVKLGEKAYSVFKEKYTEEVNYSFLIDIYQKAISQKKSEKNKAF